MEKCTTVEIYQTTEYDRFKFIEHNRPVETNKNLKESLQFRNDTALFPIIVDCNHFILDGQHRFKYCRENNLPVCYIIAHNATIEDVQRWNTTHKNWKVESFFHCYVSLGVKNYLDMKDLMQISPMPLSTFVTLFGKNRSKHDMDVFKKGKFELRLGYDKTKEILKNIQKVKDLMLEIAGIKNFTGHNYDALVMLMELPDFDIEIFLKKLRKYTEMAILAFKMKTTGDCLDRLVEHVYNKGNRVHVINKYS